MGNATRQPTDLLKRSTASPTIRLGAIQWLNFKLVVDPNLKQSSCCKEKTISKHCRLHFIDKISLEHNLCCGTYFPQGLLCKPEAEEESHGAVKLTAARPLATLRSFSASPASSRCCKRSGSWNGWPASAMSRRSISGNYPGTTTPPSAASYAAMQQLIARGGRYLPWQLRSSLLYETEMKEGE